MEIEAKRKKEEMDHEIAMMQMMGNMFTQMTNSVNSFATPVQNNMPPNTFVPNFQAPQQNHMYHQQQVPFNSEKGNKDQYGANYFTNLLQKK